MMTVQQAFELAIQHHRAGRLADAEALYRQILAVQPDNADVLHHLGIAAHQSAQNELALELIRRAIALNPNNAAAYSNLGEVCRLTGGVEEAVVAYRRAIELNPVQPEVHSNLGNMLRECGQLEEAVAACQRAIELRPGFPEAHNNLGLALQAQDHFHEAEAAFRRALELRPADASAWNNLGSVLKKMGRMKDAVGAYQRAIEIEPANPMPLNNLGAALAELGRFAEALAICRRALRLQPDQPVTLNNLGNVLYQHESFVEAIMAFRRALALKPDYAEACNQLGNALARGGEIDEAREMQWRALEIKPEYPDAHNSLGNVLREQGRLDEAIISYRRALELDSEQPAIHSNLICTLHLHPDYDEEMIAEEQARWNRQFAEPLRRLDAHYPQDRNPDRRLRIGYLAAEFRDHVVGRNLLPLFKRHDHRLFEVIGYSAVARPDEITAEFRRLSDQWREVAKLEDTAIAEMIRQDEVDILVDLAQHTADNRLLVFARKPAPVQVSFAGYPAATGVEALEYRISDRWLEANDEGRKTKECVFRLDSFWCYDSCGEAVVVNALPARENGHITFGSLNTFCKINESVLKLWARVLGNVPGSQLVLLSAKGSHRRRVAELLEREGIASERVKFFEWHPRREYLELYHRLDIVLDPFPYNGHTTSLDALWMGVPVVSFAGTTSMARAGLSILSNLGLSELVARSEDEYVEVAVQLAQDLPRLTELRATLRARMEASVLMDATGFARNIEAAYRGMWRQWCAEKAGT